MNKLSMLALISALASSGVFAADGLNNTQWKTIDDATGKPKAIVEFKQQANGSFIATIKKTLDPNAHKTCQKCTGALKDKPVEGLVIVHDLKATSANNYDGGTILDPLSGKTYKMKSEISADGKKLQVRGYIGIAALGRSQTWYRVQ